MNIEKTKKFCELMIDKSTEIILSHSDLDGNETRLVSATAMLAQELLKADGLKTTEQSISEMKMLAGLLEALKE